MDSVLITFTEDNLLAGDVQMVTSSETVLLGEGILARGTVLGKARIAKGTVEAGTNTGGGTITLDALAAGSKAKIGVYTIKCIVAVSGGGVFTVTDPDGFLVGMAVVGTAFTGGGITFRLNDGAPDFIVGDSFTFEVVAGTNKLKKITAAATDGSSAIYGVLAGKVDATSADKRAVVYLQGQFNEDALVFGSGKTKANTKDEARDLGIYYTGIANNTPV